MTIEIPIEKWKEFLDDLSRRRYGWTTRVEVLDDSVGDQILSEGLPLNGIIFTDQGSRSEIELLIGDTADHLAHAIANPVRIEFLDDENFPGGVLQIVDGNKTRTLVRLLNPMPVYLGYENFSILVAASK